MVARTRRTALRDTTPARNTTPQAGPSTTASKKPKKKAPLQIQELVETQEDIVFDDVPTITSSFEAPSTFPAIQSTPGKTRSKRRPYLVKASSPLPPSSPLPTSPAPNGNRDDEDDPWGILSLERKLKAARKTETIIRPQRVYDENGIEDMYATEQDYAGGVEDYTTIAATTEPQDAPQTPQSRPPRTPNKRINKRKPTQSPSASGSSTPHAFSSPSPVKPTEAQRAALKDTGKLKKKARVSLADEDEMDVSMMAEHLKSLLPKVKPKRPLRKVTRKTRATKEDELSESEGEQSTKRKGKKPAVSAGRKKPAIKGKRVKKKVVVELDEAQEVSLSCDLRNKIADPISESSQGPD